MQSCSDKSTGTTGTVPATILALTKWLHKRKWCLWDLNPRQRRIRPERTALDHSAKTPVYTVTSHGSETICTFQIVPYSVHHYHINEITHHVTHNTGLICTTASKNKREWYGIVSYLPLVVDPYGDGIVCKQICFGIGWHRRIRRYHYRSHCLIFEIPMMWLMQG